VPQSDDKKEGKHSNGSNAPLELLTIYINKHHNNKQSDNWCLVRVPPQAQHNI
jgi:hypothetical protein